MALKIPVALKIHLACKGWDGNEIPWVHISVSFHCITNNHKTSLSYNSRHLLFTLLSSAEVWPGGSAILSQLNHVSGSWLTVSWSRLASTEATGGDSARLLLSLTLQQASPGMFSWRCQRIRRSSPAAQGSYRPLLTSHLLTSHWPKPELRSSREGTTEFYSKRHRCKERQRAGTRRWLLLQTSTSQHMLPYSSP